MIRQKRFDIVSTADRELAINWWDSSTEVSLNKKDVIRFRSKDKFSTAEHCIHRQYQTDEYIHSTFLKHSGCEKMSLTYFTDLKPWYVRKGTDDTCLCRNCDDFRLAKKAVSYGECAKIELCKDCYDVNGEFRRMFRNKEMENESVQDGWNTNDLVSYTSYSDKKGVDTSSMSFLCQHNVHPSLFMDYFNRIAVEYAKHLSKLIRQKNAQREQERNIVPHILIVDKDFSQNFFFLRKSAI